MMSSSGSSDVGCSRKHPFLPGCTPGSSEVLGLEVPYRAWPSPQKRSPMMSWRQQSEIKPSGSASGLKKVCTPPSRLYFWHVWKQNRFPLLNDIGSQGLPRTMQLGHQWNMVEIAVQQKSRKPKRILGVRFFLNVFLLSPVSFQNQHAWNVGADDAHGFIICVGRGYGKPWTLTCWGTQKGFARWNGHCSIVRYELLWQLLEPCIIML